MGRPDTESDEAPDNNSSEALPDSSMWFYRHRGKLYGPVSLIDLRATAHLGFLQPSDAVLCEGQKKWLVARTITGLFLSLPEPRGS